MRSKHGMGSKIALMNVIALNKEEKQKMNQIKQRESYNLVKTEEEITKIAYLEASKFSTDKD